MKRIGNIYEKMITDESIEEAIYAAAKGKHNRPEILKELTKNRIPIV